MDVTPPLAPSATNPSPHPLPIDVDQFLDRIGREHRRFICALNDANRDLATTGQLTRVASIQTRLTQEFLDAQRAILKRRAETDAVVADIAAQADEESSAIMSAARSRARIASVEPFFPRPHLDRRPHRSAVRRGSCPRSGSATRTESLARLIDGAFESAEPDGVAARRQLRELLDAWWEAEKQEAKAATDDASARAAMLVHTAKIEAGEIARFAPPTTAPQAPADYSHRPSTSLPSPIVNALDETDHEHLDDVLAHLLDELDDDRAEPELPEAGADASDGDTMWSAPPGAGLADRRAIGLAERSLGCATGGVRSLLDWLRWRWRAPVDVPAVPAAGRGRGVGPGPRAGGVRLMEFEAATQSTASNGVSVEAIEEQRARLEADLATATARKLAAQHRAAQLDAEAKELLRAELAASRQTLAEIERQHAETIALGAAQCRDRGRSDPRRCTPPRWIDYCRGRRTRDRRPMIDESTMTDATQLSPRAAIALLTLQLRSTVQEAVEAEAAADAIDVDGALWQLRSRLTPLIDERRRALDEEVARERAHAAEAIAAAHAEADQITTAAIEAAAARALAERAAADLARRDAEWQSLVAPPPVEPNVSEPETVSLGENPLLELPMPAARLLDPPVVESDVEEALPAVDAPPAEDALPGDDASPELFDQAVFWGHEPDEPADESADAEVAATAVPLPPPLPPIVAPDTLVQPTTDSAPDDDLWARTVERSDDGAMRVVLDADSFARAFAAAMAPILEAREQQAQKYVLPPAAYLQPQAPPPKRSFWAHAWHPDVLLSGLAMVIVIIVLVAWTG